MTRRPGRSLEDLELDKFDSHVDKTYVRTSEITDYQIDTLDYVVNTVTSSVIRVTAPADTEYVTLIHRSDETVYLGKDALVTTATGIPFLKNEVLELSIKKNSLLNIFAITTTGPISLYAIAMVES